MVRRNTTMNGLININDGSPCARRRSVYDLSQSKMQWQTFPARVVRGYQVASGSNGNPLFPGGTLRMQAPHFLARGLDLSLYHNGTLNVSIAPNQYRVVRPRQTFRGLKWHPTEPAEDFSFFDARFLRQGATEVCGLVYLPHPETKPRHFQNPDILELLFPWIEDLSCGMEIFLQVPISQLVIESDPATPSREL